MSTLKDATLSEQARFPFLVCPQWPGAMTPFPDLCGDTEAGTGNHSQSLPHKTTPLGVGWGGGEANVQGHSVNLSQRLVWNWVLTVQWER